MRKTEESEAQKKFNLAKDEVQVLFIDFTGIRREESFSLDDELSTLHIMEGTTPIISM